MLTLNEDFDERGRLIQTIGTFTQNGSNNQGLPTWGLPYLVLRRTLIRGLGVKIRQVFVVVTEPSLPVFH